MEHAPTLRNYLERQTYTIKPAPDDYEARLRATTLLEPVLVVRPDFEPAFAGRGTPVVEIVSDSANQRASATVPTLQRLLQGFNQSAAAWRWPCAVSRRTCCNQWPCRSATWPASRLVQPA